MIQRKAIFPRPNVAPPVLPCRRAGLVPVIVPLSQFRPSVVARPVRRTLVRVVTAKPTRVKSGYADGAVSPGQGRLRMAQLVLCACVGQGSRCVLVEDRWDRSQARCPSPSLPPPPETSPVGRVPPRATALARPPLFCSPVSRATSESVRVLDIRALAC